MIDFEKMIQMNMKTQRIRTICREGPCPLTGDLMNLPFPLSHTSRAYHDVFLPVLQGQVIQVTATASEGKWSYGTLTFDPQKKNDFLQQGWFPSILCKTLSADTFRQVVSCSVDYIGRKYPITWEKGKEGFVTVVQGSKEYQEVSKCLKRMKGGSYVVTKVERIQSSELWDCYVAKRDALIARNTEYSNYLVANKDLTKQERQWLFHGTSSASATKIARHGFNRSFAGRSHGTAYGRGAYFATKAPLAIKYMRGFKEDHGFRLLLCRVVVGDWCKGNPEQLAPDTKPGHKDLLFDSTVDRDVDPRIFVIYHDSQVYPEYAVTLATSIVDL